MKRALLLSTLMAPLLAALISPALAGPGGEVLLASPAPDALGDRVIRGRAVIEAWLEGGVSGASFGAFHVRGAGVWSQGDAVGLHEVDKERFLSEPWPSAGLPNGAYELEVRVWDEVPAYDPADPATFSARVFRVVIDNAPPAPEKVLGVASVRAARLSWTPVAEAERGDFEGYRVWAAPGVACPEALEDYELLAEFAGTSFASAGLEPGRTCFRVTAARFSATTGSIDSVLSAPLRLLIPATAAQAARGAGGARVAGAPEPARLASEDPTPPTREGTFRKRLPYAPGAPVEEPPALLARRDVTDEPGPIGASTARVLAGGSILLLSGIQLRLFLRKGRVL